MTEVGAPLPRFCLRLSWGLAWYSFSNWPHRRIARDLIRTAIL